MAIPPDDEFDSVPRWLVTGTDIGQLERFFAPLADVVNPIDQRDMTIIATLYAENRDRAIEQARKAGVTVQERARQEPYWPVLVQGDTPAWKKPE